MRVRTRFVPKSTEPMHVGSARIALYNYLFTRKKGGEFVVRIEDLRNEENKNEMLEQCFIDMRWLKMDWDEGPNKGGKFGPYRQSQRLKLYMDHFHILQEKGLVYPCYCSIEELAAQRQEALQQGALPRYSNACRSLTDEKKRELDKSGKKPVFRFKVEPEILTINDLIHGEISFDTSELGDVVILDADGVPSPYFTEAVDDALMQISHVIRGDHHIALTPYHVMLLRAFGYKIPEFAHIGLIYNKQSEVLTKSELHSLFSIAAIRDQGYLPEAVINCLLHLGQPVDDEERKIVSPQVIDSFELQRHEHLDAFFDYQTLNKFSSYYLSHVDLTRITDLAIPYLKKAELISGNLTEDAYRYLSNVIDIVRHHVSSLSEMVGYAEIFYTRSISLSKEMERYLEREDARVVLRTALTVIENWNKPYEQDTMHALVGEITKCGLDNEEMLHTSLRYALTGHEKGPDLTDICWLLGKETMTKRLKERLGEYV